MDDSILAPDYRLTGRLYGSTELIDSQASSGNFALMADQHLILSWVEEHPTDFAMRHRFARNGVIFRGRLSQSPCGHHTTVEFFDCLWSEDKALGVHELEFLKQLLAQDLLEFTVKVSLTHER